MQRTEIFLDLSRRGCFGAEAFRRAAFQCLFKAVARQGPGVAARLGIETVDERLVVRENARPPIGFSVRFAVGFGVRSGGVCTGVVRSGIRVSRIWVHRYGTLLAPRRIPEHTPEDGIRLAQEVPGHAMVFCGILDQRCVPTRNDMPHRVCSR